VLTADSMRKEFLAGVPNKAEKAVQVFIASRSNAESALKTKPKVSSEFPTRYSVASFPQQSPSGCVEATSTGVWLSRH